MKRRSLRTAGSALLAVLGLFALQSPAAAQLEFTGDSVAVSSTFDGRHTFVKGQVGSFDDLDVIIDSGSGANLIDPAIAEANGFEVVDQMTVMSGGTDPITADIVIVPEFIVGDMTLRNARFLALQLLPNMQAILGMPAFNEHLLTYDPANDLIIVSGGTLSADDPEVVPFTRTRSLQITADINGRTIPVTLDTGSSRGLFLPYHMRDSLRLASELQQLPDARLIGGTRSMWKATLDGTLRVAGLTYSDPEIEFMDPAATANIGGQILKDARLTIDQRSRLPALRPYPAGTRLRTVAEERRVGVGINPGQDPPAILSVEAGSLADNAGLHVGDVILRLNGKSLSERGPGLGQLFRGNEPLVFEIERDGEAMTIEIR